MGLAEQQGNSVSEQLRTALTGGVDHPLNADRVDELERSELPAEAPTHHAVHVLGGVGDVRRHLGGVDQRRRECLAKKSADSVATVEQRANTIGSAGGRAGRLERGQPRS